MIISKNTTLHDVYDEDITVKANSTLTFTGISNKNIFVEDTGTLILKGIINGDISISSFAKASILGIVNADVINHGSLQISGIVKHLHDFADDTKIIPGACVNGIQY